MVCVCAQGPLPRLALSELALCCRFFCHFFIFQATILISGGKRAPSGSESSEREREGTEESAARGLGPRQRNGRRHVARFIVRQAPYDFQSRGKTVSDRVCVQSRQELRVHDDRGLWNRRSRVRDAAEGAGQAHRSGQLLSHLLHLPFRGHADHGVSVIGLELFFFSTLFFFRTHPRRRSLTRSLATLATFPSPQVPSGCQVDRPKVSLPPMTALYFPRALLPRFC